MTQIQTYFDKEIAKVRAMIDEPINQQFVEKQIEAVESIHNASYSDLRREMRA